MPDHMEFMDGLVGEVTEDGVELSAEHVRIAKGFLVDSEGLWEEEHLSIGVGPEGNILMCFDDGPHHLEVEFAADGRSDVYYRHRTKQRSELLELPSWGPTYDAAFKFLRRMQKERS